MYFKLCLNRQGNRPRIREQALFMAGMGAEEMWEGVWKKYSIQRGLSKRFLILERCPKIFCVLQSPKNPRGGTQLDQISSDCTSIQILMRSLQHANMITFRSHDDSKLIL